MLSKHASWRHLSDLLKAIYVIYSGLRNARFLIGKLQDFLVFFIDFEERMAVFKTNAGVP